VEGKAAQPADGPGQVIWASNTALPSIKTGRSAVTIVITVACL
jgi:hypothetical protein